MVGRDPRASGEMLEAAVVAGLASAGADAVRVGVLPTPAVAHLVDALGADLGVMISASHNAMPDNGIKLFAAGGHKLPDAVELAVEEGVGAPFTRPTGAAGSAACATCRTPSRATSAHLLASTPQPLAGLRVVVDCAYGAASAVAPDCYARAGAEVIALHADPDGLNINDGRRLDPPRRRCARRSARTARTWASPTTATPTAAWPSTRTGATSTATRSWRCWPSRCTRPASSSTTPWSPPS